MASSGSILPWKEKFNQDNEITTLVNADPEDGACLTVGRFIREWFRNHPDEQELVLRRDAAGVPTVKTNNTKQLRRTMRKTTFDNVWRY